MVAWIVKGDLEYYASVWGLEHWQGAAPCMFCKADKGNCPWTEQRLLGHPKFQRIEATCRPQCAQVALQCPVAHAVSLGVAQHIAGNILHEIFYVVLADM